ncbi:hypothetical protein [Cognatiyoonia sp. IB215182]|uniref:hypothetical protein n=1 Tax=Cognatiyoonia sp. IB215182 TaxID=3097353 RepID=UPI002A0C0199|nr:hypothetical protein [Cognatiyoonia sp. IB215182]MDX8354328.1 hypothetical protein [Cognatiyoonia sp. IB215182]
MAATKAFFERLELRCIPAVLGMDAFSYFDLAAAVHTDTNRVQVIVKAWERNGLTKSLGKGKKNRLHYQLTATGRQALMNRLTPPTQSPRANMWTAMRQLKEFTPRDVALTASTKEVEISIDDARAFCRFLLKGDEPYLRVRRKAIPHEQEAAYQLIRNTGRSHPREVRVRATYDDNLGTFTHLPEPT